MTHSAASPQSSSTTQGPREHAATTVHIMLPAYNEAEGLPPMFAAIDATLRHHDWEYLVTVVDDGSTDGTADVVQDAANHLPVRLVPHPQNMGLAAAMRTGFREVARLAEADDIIVTLDSDNTHPIGLMPRMLDLLMEGRDIVIASRFHRDSRVRGVSTYRQCTAIAAAVLFKGLFPIRGVRDYTCGYRVYRAAALKRALEVYGDRFISEEGFSCMVDILLKTSRLNLIYGEAPMILRYDKKHGPSKMNVGANIVATLKLAMRRRLGKFD